MLKSVSTFLLFLSLLAPLRAVSYYVSPAGLNTNSGTSIDAPWQTIQHACNNATPGSIVYIFAGTYGEKLYMNVSGNALDGEITFTEFGNGPVIVDGTPFIGTQTELLVIEDQSYIRINGLSFANAIGGYSKGIIIRGSSSNIELINNEIYNIHFSDDPMAIPTSDDNANPLLVYGDDELSVGPDVLSPISNILINGNSIHNCRTGYSEGLTVNGNVDGFTIHNNFVCQITNIGIDVAGGYGVSPDPLVDYARNGEVTGNVVYQCNSAIAVAAGIYADGSQDILIEHNNVHDCGRGYEVGCESLGAVAQNIVVRNNIAWGNSHAGIGIGGYNYPATTGKVVSCKVLNNTCYDNAQVLFGEGELYIEYTEDCVIKNNIFYATNLTGRLLVSLLNSDGDPSTNLVLDYNLYYSQLALPLPIDWDGFIIPFADIFTETGQEEHALFANPNFVDAFNQDFHLGSFSPAFNACDPMFVPEIGELDFYGNPREIFDIVDIGAHEASIDLPVEYLRPLYGRAVPQGIELRWSTATERHASRYDIERSADGTVFEKIGEQSARGNSSGTVDYAFLDKKPLTGANYYRLRQVDFDGTAALSHVAVVKWQSASTGIYPNPASGVFEIKNAGTWEKAVLKNALGQMVRTFNFSEQTSLDGLKSGVYLLEVFETENGAPQVYSIIKL